MKTLTKALLWRLGYAALCLRRAPAALAFSPCFVVTLTIRRLLFSITRRFCGPSLRSPITGEIIFNKQSLINAFAMQIVGELDGSWQDHLRETPAPVVFDVGSNIGQFRAFALSFNPQTKVWTWDCWADLASHVPSDRHCVSALGGKSGTALLQRDGTGWTASTASHFYAGETIEVPVLRLDDEWERLGKPNVDVLKIDVDGAEFEVLKGSKETLINTRFVIVETSDLDAVKALCPNRQWSTKNGYDFVGSMTVT